MNFYNNQTRFYYGCDSFMAGMVLTSAQTLMLNKGTFNMDGAWCYFKDGVLIMKASNEEIPLLLKKSELRKIQQFLQNSAGKTIIAESIDWRPATQGKRMVYKAYIKCGMGKKAWDRRDKISEKARRRERD